MEQGYNYISTEYHENSKIRLYKMTKIVKIPHIYWKIFMLKLKSRKNAKILLGGM